MSKNINPVKKGEVLYVYTDGASRGNPGPAAIAYIMGIKKNEEWIEIARHKEYIGEHTNNVAEYRAIIKALTVARKYSRWNLIIHSDSQLVIRQINREYRIKSEQLANLCDVVYEKKEFYENVEFVYVPRTNPYIKECDRLCNEMLDEIRGKKNGTCTHK